MCVAVNCTLRLGEQQDAHEFLMFLFDVLLENVPSAKELYHCYIYNMYMYTVYNCFIIRYADDIKRRTHVDMTQKGTK